MHEAASKAQCPSVIDDFMGVLLCVANYGIFNLRAVTINANETIYDQRSSVGGEKRDSSTMRT